MKRNRMLYFIVAVVITVVALCTRRFASSLPAWSFLYLGDVLWALMLFVLLGFIFPKLSTVKIALIALVISVLAETSQLYQAAWINQIRRTTVGGIILGFGFLWTDLICYCAGIGAGVLFEIAAPSKTRKAHRLRN